MYMATDMGTDTDMVMIKKKHNADILIIIQARVNSTRLPQKMLLPIYEGQTILEIIIEKLKTITSPEHIVLATTLNPLDDDLVHIADKKGIGCYRGAEEHVLSRFTGCAKFYKYKKIIRVCSDNPFIDMELLKGLMAYSVTANADYCSYAVNGIPAIKTHFGFFAEYVGLDALEKVERSTGLPFYTEHVTNYIYLNEKEFSVRWLTAPSEIENSSGIRLTVDTTDDFKVARQIYGSLYSAFGSRFGYREILEYIRSNHEYKEIMIRSIETNGK